MAAPSNTVRIKEQASRRLPSAACSAFAKLQAAYDDPKPVRLTAGEAASIYRSLRNQEIHADNIADSAAGNFGDISWQNVDVMAAPPEPK
jgi:hypothetical protein